MSDGVFVSLDGDIHITPSEDDATALAAYEGKEVTVGIRSERFISGGELGDTFRAEIEVVEMLGKEKLLYGKLPKGSITISVGRFEYRGEEHSFGYDIEAIHYFDSSTTNRIV